MSLFSYPMQAVIGLETALAGKAAVVHTHVMGDVDGLIAEFAEVAAAISAVNGSIVTDHGALSGLSDDDHPQYAKKAGDTFTGAVAGTTLTLIGNVAAPDQDVVAIQGAFRVYGPYAGHTLYDRAGGNVWVAMYYANDAVRWFSNTALADVMVLTETGSLTIVGDFAADNFSGASSGTNTGDQDLSDYALTATVDAALADKADLIGGVLDTSQLPAIAVVDFLGEVVNEAAMLALDGQKGDWCIRTDNSFVYVITGDDPSDAGDWTPLEYPASPVLTVNGQTGTVVLTYSSVGAAAASHTHAIADSTGLQTALDGKQPLDGDLTALAALGYTSGSYIAKKTAANTWALIAITTAGEAVLDDADAAAQRVTLGVAAWEKAVVILSPVDGTVPGSMKLPYGLTFASLVDVWADDGTLDLTVKNNGSSMTAGAIAVTTSASPVTLTTNLAYTAENPVTFEIANKTGSPTRLYLAFRGTR